MAFQYHHTLWLLLLAFLKQYIHNCTEYAAFSGGGVVSMVWHLSGYQSAQTITQFFDVTLQCEVEHVTTPPTYMTMLGKNVHTNHSVISCYILTRTSQFRNNLFIMSLQTVLKTDYHIGKIHIPDL